MFFSNKKIKILIFIVSVIATVVICRFKGEVWEENVREVLYKLKNDTVPSYNTEIVDSIGVPYVFYSPQNNISAGKHYNPTVVANYALQYFSKINKEKNAQQYFNNCVQYLLSSISYKNNAALYYYNWQQPWYPEIKGTFTSGMTSGRAIEVFIKAFSLNNDSMYLQVAQKLMRGYYIAVADSGFTYKQNNAWWYEEIAVPNTSTPYILDGHIFAIKGLQAFNSIFKNDSAQILIQQGLAALKEKLPLYDAGNGIIFYDKYKSIADKKYQHILVAQMQQLWLSTNDAMFLAYYKKWSAPLNKNYFLKVFAEKNISGIVLFFTLLISIFILLLFVQEIFLKIKQH